MWSAAVAFLVALNLGWVLGPILGFFLLERIIPAERGQPIRGTWNNLRMTLVYQVVFTAYYPTVATLLAVYLFSPLHAGWIDLRFATRGNVSLELASFLLFIIVFDFFYYWFHRMQHQIGWLWVQHRLHHSLRDLNAAGTLSHHWIEELLRVPVVTVPLALLFQMNPIPAGLFTIVAQLNIYFIHANIRCWLGPLTPFIAGPQVHRIHHSRLPQHANKNFAAFFPVWDILFGTYWASERDEYPPTGVEGFEQPRSVAAVVSSPFVAW